MGRCARPCVGRRSTSLKDGRTGRCLPPAPLPSPHLTGQQSEQDRARPGGARPGGASDSRRGARLQLQPAAVQPRRLPRRPHPAPTPVGLRLDVAAASARRVCRRRRQRRLHPQPRTGARVWRRVGLVAPQAQAEAHGSRPGAKGHRRGPGGACGRRTRQVKAWSSGGRLRQPLHTKRPLFTSRGARECVQVCANVWTQATHNEDARRTGASCIHLSCTADGCNSARLPESDAAYEYPAPTRAMLTLAKKSLLSCGVRCKLGNFHTAVNSLTRILILTWQSASETTSTGYRLQHLIRVSCSSFGRRPRRAASHLVWPGLALTARREALGRFPGCMSALRERHSFRQHWHEE
jgi:hypothetical protein